MVRDLYAGSLLTIKEHITYLLNDAFGNGDKYLSDLALDALFDRTTEEPHSMLDALVSLWEITPAPIRSDGKIIGCEITMHAANNITVLFDTDIGHLFGTNGHSAVSVKIHEWDILRLEEINNDFLKNYAVNAEV